MPPPSFIEGEIPFDAPGTSKPCKTWYKVVGDLTTPPLVALHGGPGAGHEYLTSLTDLHEKYKIPIIYYDQIGCGRSTRFPEKTGDDLFWTFNLFIQELENLVRHFNLHQLGFYILGQSWGGIFGGAYASSRPEGLRKLVLAGAPASIPLYAKGCRDLLSQLPKDVRETIEECERKGDFESPEYEKASAVFYGQHVCRLDPFPEPVMMAFQHLHEDPTAYLTIQGPSEFTIIGNFKDWEGWKEAHNINVPTLLINGKYDEVTDSCVKPWFNTIPRIRWVTLENSSHMTHFEERDRFMELCGEFLSND
ncbi:proline iminopeptidase [Annulohypoxylon truncatum]|uniref:proline iminopeptidase n=1 Tax=Annulohypoxylon truncatum TaxID=327061 RepID=UPI002008050B|nr:proline iminopeptidase [Annulohypoxylon truncatum]KAI1205004.1 proline iminopeptidase [Annulohypoxylon truncatum]